MRIYYITSSHCALPLQLLLTSLCPFLAHVGFPTQHSRCSNFLNSFSFLFVHCRLRCPSRLVTLGFFHSPWAKKSVISFNLWHLCFNFSLPQAFFEALFPSESLSPDFVQSRSQLKFVSWLGLLFELFVLLFSFFCNCFFSFFFSSVAPLFV